MASAKEQVQVELDFVTSGAIKNLGLFSSAFDRNFKKLEFSNKRSFKKILTINKDYWKQQKAAAQTEDALQKKLQAAVVASGAAQKKRTDLEAKLFGERLKWNAAQLAATEKLSAAQLSGDKEAIKEAKKLQKELETKHKKEEKAITDQVSALKDLAKEYKDVRRETSSQLEEARREIEKLLEDDIEFELKPGAFKDAAKGFGEGASEAFSSFARKDGVGVGEGIAKAFGKSALGGMKKLGAALAQKGAALQAGGGGGGITKMLGGLMKGLGPLINTLGRLAPIISLVSGGVMALVKLFLDAEAGAKEFQRGILSTSSTLGFLNKNLGDTDVAAYELGITLKGMRDAAFSINNVKWGLNKDDYATTMNELTSAGVQLDKFKSEAEEAYATSRGLKLEDVQANAKKSTEAVQELTENTMHLAAAYSRTMGVTLQEVSSLMGEMKGQIGMPTESIKIAFGKIAMEAEDSGIAANQFFNIIRGMSSDMSLFNNRMEIAGKMLSKLTKVMDPRKASQFVQTIQNYFKSQDLQSRLKSVLIAGKGTSHKIIQEDINMKVEGLAEDLRTLVKPEDLKKAVAGGMGAATKFLVDHGEKMSGAQREAILDAARQQEKVSRGGAVNLASALKDVSPIGAMEMLEAKSRSMFKTSIENLSENQLLAAGAALDMDDDLIDKFSKFNAGLRLSQAEIAKRLRDGSGTAEQQAADQRLLVRLGLKSADDNKKMIGADVADAVMKKDQKEIFKNLGHDAQEALTKEVAQENLAEKSVKHQQSILDKLGALMDFFMNTFYNAIMGIWDSISNLIGAGGKEKYEAAQAAKAAKSETVNKALSDAGGDPAKMMHNLLDGKDSFLEKAFAGHAKKMEELAKARDAEKDSDKRSVIEKKMRDLEKSKDAQLKELTTHSNTRGSLEKMSGWGGKMGEMASKALEGNKYGVTMSASLDKVKSGGGYSKDEVAAFEKALAQSQLWSMDPKAAMSFVAPLEKAMDPNSQAEAIKKAQEAVDQAGANDGVKQLAVDGHPSSNSISVHDKHAEPLLASIAAVLGASGDATKTPELGEAETANSLAEEQVEEQEVTRATLADIYNVLRIKGIRIHQSHLNTDIKKVITDGTQEAMETALFEFALLTDNRVAKDAMQSAMSGGSGAVTGSGIMRGLWESSQTHIKSGAYSTEKADEARKAEDEARRIAEEGGAPADGGTGVAAPVTGGGGTATGGAKTVHIILETTEQFDALIYTKASSAADVTVTKRRRP